MPQRTNNILLRYEFLLIYRRFIIIYRFLDLALQRMFLENIKFKFLLSIDIIMRSILNIFVLSIENNSNKQKKLLR